MSARATKQVVAAIAGRRGKRDQAIWRSVLRKRMSENANSALPMTATFLWGRSTGLPTGSCSAFLRKLRAEHDGLARDRRRVTLSIPGSNETGCGGSAGL